MTGYLDFDRIEHLGLMEVNVSELPTQVIKLQEEAGEVAAAYLAYAGTNNASGSALKEEDLYSALLEEVIDVMIVCADIVNKMTIDEDEHGVFYDGEAKLKKLVDRKLTKWGSKQNLRHAKEKMEKIETFLK